MSVNLGDFFLGQTVYVKFSSADTTGGRADFSSALEAADIRLYKNGGATERSSTSGFTVTSGFDSMVGVNHVAIDTSDNTDAGFYAVGNDYQIVAYPDETLDGESVAAVIGHFSIQNRPASQGALWRGTLSAIADGSITLPSGNGMDHEANLAVSLESGTNARGKARFLVYSGSGEVWNVDPAWNVEGQTTPSGTIIASVFTAPMLPTTVIPDVNVAQISEDAVTEMAAGVFSRAFNAAYSSLTFDELVKLMAAVLLGKASGLGTNTATFRNLADSGDAVVATVDADGNRTAVTRTP